MRQGVKIIIVRFYTVQLWYNFLKFIIINNNVKIKSVKNKKITKITKNFTKNNKIKFLLIIKV